MLTSKNTAQKHFHASRQGAICPCCTQLVAWARSPAAILATSSIALHHCAGAAVPLAENGIAMQQQQLDFPPLPASAAAERQLASTTDQSQLNPRHSSDPAFILSAMALQSPPTPSPIGQSQADPAHYYLNGGNPTLFLDNILITDPSMPLDPDTLHTLRLEHRARMKYIHYSEQVISQLLAQPQNNPAATAAEFTKLSCHRARTDAILQLFSKHDLAVPAAQWQTVKSRNSNRSRQAATAAPPSAPVQTNKYQVLAAETTASTTTAADAGTSTSASGAAKRARREDATAAPMDTTAAPPAAQAPPQVSQRTTPIFMRDPLDTPKVQAALAAELPDLEFQVRNMRNTVAFLLKTPTDHRRLREFLTAKSFQYLTTLLPAEKLLHVTLKNLPMYIGEEEVKAYLLQQNFPVERVGQLRNNRCQPPKALPHFRVALKKEGNAAEIHKLTTMFHAVISVETYRPPARPLQCMNCQQFTHGSARCGLQKVCSFCGEAGHARDTCQRLGIPGAKPSCYNCGGEHSARYAKCPVWQEARVELLLNKRGERTRVDAAPKVANPHGLPRAAFQGARYPGLPPLTRVQYPNYAAAASAASTQQLSASAPPQSAAATAPQPAPPTGTRPPQPATRTPAPAVMQPARAPAPPPGFAAHSQPAQQRLPQHHHTTRNPPQPPTQLPDAQLLGILEHIPLHLQADFAAALAIALLNRPPTIPAQTQLVLTVYTFLQHHGSTH